MAQINVGELSFEVDDGIRLVLALEDNGVDILHRCGGNAACTTCRVTFTEGEPEAVREAEAEALAKRDLTGTARLSCQIMTDGAMTLAPVMTVSTSDMDDAGSRPSDEMTP